MEQQKIKVVVYDKIDTSVFDEMFFTILFNRILELRGNKIAPTKTNNRTQ